MPPKTRFTYRQQYDDARDAEERALTDIDTGPETLTQQHHAEDADLNTIIKRYGLHDYAVPPQALDKAHFGDFSYFDGIDLKTVLDTARNAQESFHALPAKIRARFNNDPAQLLEFVHNDENLDEAITLGLLHEDYKKPEPTAPPAPPAPKTP